MLSKRLRKIAEMIQKDEVVFDCGSDHALLPCFLIQNNYVKKVYAGDVRQGPLNQARANIERFHLEDRIIPVLSDGLDEMKEDVTVVSISGMGFYTVEEILNRANLSQLKQIVVQINRNVDQLRRYLSEHHYTILDEAVVHDDFYYEIIAFSTETHEPYSEQEIQYGPILLEKKEDTFLEYLQYHIRQQELLFQKHPDPTIRKRIEEMEEIIKETDITSVTM